jgi:putative transposase
VHRGANLSLGDSAGSEPHWQLEEGIKLSLLIDDRDRRFPGSFDRIFESQGGRMVLTPLLAPRANAHAERWIGSCRRNAWIGC